jgi:starch-binding outer membrane protein, SusD/RagB family
MRSKKLVLGLTALVAMSGCMDLEENIVTGVTGSYFGTPEGADAAITGTYERLRNIFGNLRESAIYMTGTDDWEKGGEAGGDGLFNDYTSALAGNMSNTVLRDQWQNLYQAVDAANTAIFHIGASTQIPESTKRVRLGEAHFLRAFFYHELTQTWGDVHLQLEPSAGATRVANRTPVSQIYADAMVPDLEFAIANLPQTQPQFGRATRGAAQTLLAEVLLRRAAPGDFDRVVQLTTDVINSGVYRLNPTFYGVFCGNAVPEACEHVVANKQNPEFIFSVQFTADPSTNRWGSNKHMLYVMGYDLQGAVKSGRPNLSRTIPYSRPIRRARPTLNAINIFDRENDGRYDATFQTMWRYSNGDTAIWMPGIATPTTEMRARPYAVWGQNQYTNILFPVVRKWLDTNRGDPNQWEGTRDRHIWRLADVYLLRAEANIRRGQVAQAIPDFNVLRERGAKAGRDNTLTPALIAELNANPIDFLLDERTRELLGEERRYYTLTRLGKLVDRVQRFNPAGSANVRPHHALRPIPQEQIDRTEGGEDTFPQNPGY